MRSETEGVLSAQEVEETDLVWSNPNNATCETYE